MMEAARTSETSVDIQLRTRQYIPEDSELQVDRGYRNELDAEADIRLNLPPVVPDFSVHQNSRIHRDEIQSLTHCNLC
jgi:hypothetical protein